jgi:4-amino-4-deoxy-L-arabinose transferase-like glycosyltransferase
MILQKIIDFKLMNLAKKLKKPIPVCAIVMLAFLVRVVFACIFLFSTDNHTYSPLEEETYAHSGSDGIVQVGHNWLTNGRFSLRPGGPEIAFRPPVPVFISGVCAVIDSSNWYIYYIAANCALSALLIYPCMSILQQCKVPEGALTNIALITIALHPYMVFSVKTLTAINLLAFLLATITSLFLYAIRGNLRSSLSLGLLIGLGILSHGSFMLLPFVCAAGMFISSLAVKTHRNSAIVCAVLTLCVSLLVVAPWTIRNYIKFNMFIPSASGSGLQFWITEEVVSGQFRGTQGAYNNLSSLYEKKTGRSMHIMHGGIIDAQQDAELASWGKQLLLDRPLHFFKRFSFGLLGFWAPIDRGFLKAILASFLNLPLVVITLYLAFKAVQRKIYDFNSVAILSIGTYIWFIFAAVQAISSYFVMVIPLFIVHGFVVIHLLRSSNRSREKSCMKQV